ncbi:MAG: FliM/FliN family flagellar motor switch protein [Pirellulaceae bacterium]|nr:FliM/FliN family flagellar motor switch protein [Pirellulaceae bacterium]
MSTIGKDIPFGSHSAADSVHDGNSWDHLPEFTRSLLKVPVTLNVTIAATMRPISLLLDIGPGAILQFEQHFETPLVLEANGEPIAEGIAVRAGENFGLQITEMKMPPERFWSVQPPRQVDSTS